MILKFKKWIVIPSLLASLSLSAQVVECNPEYAWPNLERMGQLLQDSSEAVKNISEPTVQSACYTPSTPVTNRRFIPNGSYPLRPENIPASCVCTKSNNLYLKDEELTEKWQRIQELTAMKMKMDFYLMTREKARGGIQAFLLTSDKSELPKSCQTLLDKGPEVNQDGNCRADQEKVYDLMTKVLPSFPNYNKDINAITDASFPHRYGARANSQRRGNPSLAAPDFKAPPGFFDLHKMRLGMAYRQIDPTKLEEMSREERHNAMRANVSGISSADVVRSGLYSPLPTFIDSSGDARKISTEDVENLDPKVFELLSQKIGREMQKLNRSLAQNAEFQNERGKVTDSMSFIQLARKHVPFRFNLSHRGREGVRGLNEEQSEVYKSVAQVMEGVDILGMPFAFDRLIKYDSETGVMELKSDLDKNLKNLIGYAQAQASNTKDLEVYCGAVVESAERICDRKNNEDQRVSAEEIQLFAMADLDKDSGPEYVKAVCSMMRAEDLLKIESAETTSGETTLAETEQPCYYNRPEMSYERSDYTTMAKSLDFRGIFNRLWYAEAPAECAGPSDAYKSAIVDSSRAKYSGPPTPEQAVVEAMANEASSQFAQGTVTIPLESFNDSEVIATSNSNSSLDDFYAGIRNGRGSDELYDVKEATSPKTGIVTPYTITTTGDSDDGAQSIAGARVNTNTSIADHMVETDTTAATPKNGFLTTASSWLGGSNDTGRYSIYDKSGPEASALAESESKLSGMPMSEREIVEAQNKLDASSGRYEAVLGELEKMRAELERVKDGKNDEDVDDLIADLKKQLEDVKKSREDLEERIAKEKERDSENSLREDRTAVLSRPTPKATYSSGARDDVRVSPQPTYSADLAGSNAKINVPSFSGGNIPVANSLTSSNRKSETAVVASEFTAGVVAGGNRGPGVSSAMATGGLRMTSQAFEKLSTNDLKDIYDSNGGKPIFVEVEGGNSDKEASVVKYVPKMVGEDIVYIMQEETTTEAIAEATPGDVKELNEVLESVDPGRKIASVDDTHEFADERRDMPDVRVIKEVESFEQAIYNPIHQDLILRFQQVMAGQQ